MEGMAMIKWEPQSPLPEEGVVDQMEVKYSPSNSGDRIRLDLEEEIMLALYASWMPARVLSLPVESHSGLERFECPCGRSVVLLRPGSSPPFCDDANCLLLGQTGVRFHPVRAVHNEIIVAAAKRGAKMDVVAEQRGVNAKFRVKEIIVWPSGDEPANPPGNQEGRVVMERVPNYEQLPRNPLGGHHGQDVRVEGAESPGYNRHLGVENQQWQGQWGGNNGGQLQDMHPNVLQQQGMNNVGGENIELDIQRLLDGYPDEHPEQEEPARFEDQGGGNMDNGQQLQLYDWPQNNVEQAEFKIPADDLGGQHYERI